MNDKKEKRKNCSSLLFIDILVFRFFLFKLTFVPSCSMSKPGSRVVGCGGYIKAKQKAVGKEGRRRSR